MEKLETLIEKFESRTITVDGAGNEAGSGSESAPVTDLTDAALAAGQCDGVSDDFVKLARESGFVADFEVFASPSHTAAVVETEGGSYLVDFTASQFGCETFPFVAKKRGEEIDVYGDEDLFDELEDAGYREFSPRDPYKTMDFIAAYKPL